MSCRLKSPRAETTGPRGPVLRGGDGSGQPAYRRILETLACPACGGVLVERREPVTLSCGTCGASYAVQDGVPILLTPASRALLASGQTAAPSPWNPGWLPGGLVDRIRARCHTGPGEDRRQQTRVAAFISEEREGGLVVDLGSGSRRVAASVVTVDIGPFPHVDVVADGHRLPFRNDTVSRIVGTGVLEHVNFPERVVAEMLRILRPGGRIYVAVPFLQGLHPGSGTQQDFHRYTHIGLLQLLAPFTLVEWGISGGPGAALAWVLREYLALPFAWNLGLYRITYFVAGVLTSWLPQLDRLFDRFPQARRIACGFYVIGEKSIQQGHDPQGTE